MINAEIITIGNELLIGQVVNTNAAWIAEQLNQIGVGVRRMLSVADDLDEIVSELGTSLIQSDLILVTGGLGPTSDDITKPALCRLFKCDMRTDLEVLANVTRLLSTRGLEVNNLNRMQADLPEAATTLNNPIGTAPGLWFEKNAHVLVCMPGVPFEMKQMVENHVIPRIGKLFKLPSIIHKTILTHGTYEAKLAEILQSFEQQLPKHISLAYLPSPGSIRLRLTGKGEERELLEEQMNKQLTLLKQTIPGFIFGYDKQSLEEVVGLLLRNQSLTLATAESCTGGAIAQAIVSIPGSSAYFKGSIVAYDNSIKTKLLQVNPATIKKHGAVSEETVREMLQGIRKQMGADCAIATSGIAGPDGGTPDKPVGTIWIGAEVPGRVVVKKFTYGNDRLRNIERSKYAALNLLRGLLMETQ